MLVGRAVRVGRVGRGEQAVETAAWEGLVAVKVVVRVKEGGWVISGCRVDGALTAVGLVGGAVRVGTVVAAQGVGLEVGGVLTGAREGLAGPGAGDCNTLPL